jgi:type II secretory pathway pseudopilin PulG
MTIVMAMLGILAAVGMPALEWYIRKTRQVEARNLLDNLYQAEYTFYTEHGRYSDSLQELGFMPNGNLRYNIGFAPVPGKVTDTFNLCVAGATCQMMVPDFKNKGTASKSRFMAHAIGHVGGMIADEWTIDQDHLLFNSVSGL